MTGRTGMSFASTVSSVIDVPADPQLPAWNGSGRPGRTRSRPRWTRTAPAPGTRYSASGWERAPGVPEAATTIAIDGPHIRNRRPRPSGPRTSAVDQGHPLAEEMFTSARRTMTPRRPDQRHQDERHDEAADDRASVLTPRSAAGTRSRPARCVPPGSSAEAGREAPRRGRSWTGRTTRTIERNTRR